MTETTGTYDVKACCYNCNRNGQISPRLGIPVEQAVCPYCGCVCV